MHLLLWNCDGYTKGFLTETIWISESPTHPILICHIQKALPNVCISAILMNAWIVSESITWKYVFQNLLYGQWHNSQLILIWHKFRSILVCHNSRSMLAYHNPRSILVCLNTRSILVYHNSRFLMVCHNSRSM